MKRERARGNTPSISRERNEFSLLRDKLCNSYETHLYRTLITMFKLSVLILYFVFRSASYNVHKKVLYSDHNLANTRDSFYRWRPFKDYFTFTQVHMCDISPLRCTEQFSSLENLLKMNFAAKIVFLVFAFHYNSRLRGHRTSRLFHEMSF